jgi:hypothetical protein
VAYAYNPSYSEGGGCKDHKLKPAWTKSSRDPIPINVWEQLVHWSSHLHREEQIGGSQFRLARAQSETLSQKSPVQKMLGAWLKCRVPGKQANGPEFKP